MTGPDDLFSYAPGAGAVLLSVPHAGTKLPEDFAARLRPAALALPDTDWHVARLYDFAGELGAGLVSANYSRYVIDLNRPGDNKSLYPGQATTGLCPNVQFDGTPIYLDGSEVARQEVETRKAAYWQPYHDFLFSELQRIRSVHGYAILYDCHSIASRVPRLFEGTLPVLNLGTVNGTSADMGLEQQVREVMAASGFSMAVNGRFVGGHITRSCGAPGQGIHALQMELGCDAYLADGPGYRWDDARAGALKTVLRRIVQTLTRWRP